LIKGSGLGLAIVKGAAERHGGRVYVRSEPGKGSAFFLEMPRRQLEL
jgi:signal transduction histidine kinase